MPLEEQNFERIERYITGKLSASEKIKMEHEIAMDPALENLVKLHKLEHTAIDKGIADTLRPNIQSWIEQSGEFASEPPHKTGRRIWLYLGLLLLLGTLFFWWEVRTDLVPPSNSPENTIKSSNPPINTPNLSIEPLPDTSSNGIKQTPTVNQRSMPQAKLEKARVYLSPPNLLLNARGNVRGTHSNNLDSTIVSKVVEAYMGRRYTDAILLADQISAEDELYPDALEVIGLAYAHKTRYSEAAAAFQRLLELDAFGFKDRTQWNLLLCYWASGEKSKKHFEQSRDAILNDSLHSYRNSLIKLLKEE